MEKEEINRLEEKEIIFNSYKNQLAAIGLE